jgi:hypothetical protein
VSADPIRRQTIHNPNQVILGDIVIQTIGKQQPFPPVLPLDKAGHIKSPRISPERLPYLVFPHSLGGKRILPAVCIFRK